MKEYIEREALCYQLAKQATIDGQPRAIRRAAKIVADFPATDVAPVVRCPDCFYHVDCGYHHCNKFGAPCPDDSDFFCAYGCKDWKEGR